MSASREMGHDHVSRREVARVLAGQVGRGLGVVAAVSSSLSEAATASVAALRAPGSGDDTTSAIVGRTATGSMWVRGRVADPAAAPTIAITDGTALLRLMREGDVGFGPMLGPLAAAALAGTARGVASMDVDARTNATTAIADLITRTRPASGAVRIAAARSASILEPAQPMTVIAASLDDLADDLVMRLRDGTTRVADMLESLPATGIFLAGTWSRQSIGDPWPVEGLLRRPDRTIVVAAGEPTRDGDVLLGWLDPTVRRRVDLLPETAIAAAFRARRCDIVLLSAEDVGSDGKVAAAPGTLATLLLAHHYGVPVIAVDLACALVSDDRVPQVGAPDLAALETATADVIPGALISDVIRAVGPPIG